MVFTKPRVDPTPYSYNGVDREVLFHGREGKRISDQGSLTKTEVFRSYQKYVGLRITTQDGTKEQFLDTSGGRNRIDRTVTDSKLF